MGNECAAMEMLEQMRQAREAAGLDLQAVERRTRVRLHLLEAIELGHFDHLPRGVYARSVIRAYATAIGIDPNRAVTALAPLLPEAEDALDGIARVRGLARHHEAPETSTLDAPVADVLLLHVDLPPAADGRRPALPISSRVDLEKLAARVRSAAGSWSPASREKAAAAIDGVILAGIDVLLLGLTARAAGVPVGSVLGLAAPAMATVAVLIAALYFLLLAGIVGQTAGGRLMGVPPSPLSARRIDAGTMTRRACEIAARELSILVDVALPMLTGRDGRPGAPHSQRPWAGRAAAR
jgi:hypothetical protein